MKRITLYIIGILLPLLSACEMKKDIFGGSSSEVAPSYENLGLLDIEILAEREAELRADGRVSVKEANTLESDAFAIEISDSTGQVVKSFPSWTAMKEAGELLLPVGRYTVHASYGSDVNAGFNSPYYAGDTTCMVLEKEVSKVVTKCTLQNKKVQFDVNEEFLSMFEPDYSIVVDNGLGVLTLTPEQLASAFFKNTGTLRFSLYASTYDGQVHTYTSDLSSNEQVMEHNNIYVELGAVPTIPDQPGGVDPEEPAEPEEPDDPIEPEPEEPEDPNQPKPDVPVTVPAIKVDITLIEKDYVIEIPSNFVENSKPGTGNGDTPSTPGEGSTTDPSDPSQPVTKEEAKITGTLNGKSFDINQEQTIKEGDKVVINLYVPTGLAALKAVIRISGIDPITADLLNYQDHALAGVFAGLGLPKKGDKGNLKFDISPFITMMSTSNSFEIYLEDANKTSHKATIKLKK